MSWLHSKFLWLILIASLAFNAGVGTTFGIRAYSRHSDGPWHGPPPHPAGEFLEGLNLEPDELERMRAESNAVHARIRALHQTVIEELAALSDLLLAIEPDRDAIAAQLDKLADLHRQKQEYIVQHFLGLGELLEGDQRETFEETIRGVFLRCRPGHPGFKGRHRGHERFGAPEERHQRDLDD